MIVSTIMGHYMVFNTLAVSGVQKETMVLPPSWVCSYSLESIASCLKENLLSMSMDDENVR